MLISLYFWSGTKWERFLGVEDTSKCTSGCSVRLVTARYSRMYAYIMYISTCSLLTSMKLEVGSVNILLYPVEV